MRILLTSAHPQLPELIGGAQTSGNRLAELLNARGHTTAVFGGLMGKGFVGFVSRIKLKLLRAQAVCDHHPGYPVWRGWFPWEGMAKVVTSFKPDVIVVLAGQPVKIAIAAQQTGVPVLMMLQDVEFDAHGGNFHELGNLPCVANSAFTAQRYRETYGVDPIVIHPMIDGTRYRTETTRENITFINPHPYKGLNIIAAVAQACPDIPFSIYESWPLSDEQRAELNSKLVQLPNVTLNSPVRDMKQVYGKAKILMAPSMWEEAYGRVATEAQFSGIPVIASNRGGLPEAVGPGGVLLDPEGPIEPWIAAIRRLWDEPEYYSELSQKALDYARRPALNQDHQMDLWEKALHQAAGVPQKNAA